MHENIKSNQTNEIEAQDSLNLVQIDNSFDLSSYERVPISLIGGLGAVALPIIEGMQALGAAGGSGIYMVSTEGGKLAWSAAKNAYIGGMTTASGELAQASLRPVVFNPTTICIAVTMVAAIVKLDEISNNVKEVIETF